jgi:hypothetical protein
VGAGLGDCAVAYCAARFTSTITRPALEAGLVPLSQSTFITPSLRSLHYCILLKGDHRVAKYHRTVTIGVGGAATDGYCLPQMATDGGRPGSQRNLKVPWSPSTATRTPSGSVRFRRPCPEGNLLRTAFPAAQVWLIQFLDG